MIISQNNAIDPKRKSVPSSVGNSETDHDPAATLVSGKGRTGDRMPRHRPGRYLPLQADPLGDPVRTGRQLRRDLAYRCRAHEPAARADGADRQSSGCRRRGRPGGRGQRTGRWLHDRHGELHRGLRRADLRRQAADAAGPGAGQHADHGAHPRGHAVGQPLHRHEEAFSRSEGQPSAIRATARPTTWGSCACS